MLGQLKWRLLKQNSCSLYESLYNKHDYHIHTVTPFMRMLKLARALVFYKPDVTMNECST